MVLMTCERAPAHRVSARAVLAPHHGADLASPWCWSGTGWPREPHPRRAACLPPAPGRVRRGGGDG